MECGTSSRTTSPGTRCRGTSRFSMSYRATRPARCSSGSSCSCTPMPERRHRGRRHRPRLRALLDHVGGIPAGPVLQAAMELWVAARTDSEIRTAMDGVTRGVTRLVGEGASELFPTLMGRPRARELLDM